jgi:hypothetical protein
MQAATAHEESDGCQQLALKQLHDTPTIADADCRY